MRTVGQVMLIIAAVLAVAVAALWLRARHEAEPHPRPAPAVLPAAPPAPIPTPAAPPPKSPPLSELSESQQIDEDAAAVGMTTREPDGSEAAPDGAKGQQAPPASN